MEKKETEEERKAKVEIWKYVFGFTEMAVVKCAIELGIPDALENRENPVALTDLASELGCSAPSLYRIMRFLTNRGIFKEKSNGYIQSPLSHLLVRNGKKSMADFILLESSPAMLAPWHKLSAGVLANRSHSAFEEAHGGDDVWQYAEANPEHCKLIDKAMDCNVRVAVPAIIDGYPEVFEGLQSLVDVGGGGGTTLRLIVEACPWIKGINFDLPHVVREAPKYNGVEHVGGNFFLNVPKADATYLMWVLHDWGDDECIQILKNCREAIPQDTGKVIIVEAILERTEENELKDVGLMLDMIMMAHTSKGKERTLKEWAYVLREAGFTRYTVKHLQAVQSVIVAYP